VKAAVVREPGADPIWADFEEPVIDREHRLAYLLGAGIHPVVRSMVAGRHYGSADVWQMQRPLGRRESLPSDATLANWVD
jgi:hypothetical protein